MPKNTNRQDNLNNWDGRKPRVPKQNTGFIIKMLIAVIAVNVCVISVLAVIVARGMTESEDSGNVPVMNNYETPVPVTNNQTASPESNKTEASKTEVNNDEEKVNNMLAEVETGLIYENIYINNIHVGNMTIHDAEEKLARELQEPLELEKITAVKGADTYSYTFSEIGAEYDIKSAVQKAYDFARYGDINERYAQITALKLTRYDIEAVTSFSVEQLDAVIESIAKKYEIPVVNATASRKNGEFFFTQESDGYSIDKNTLASDISKLVRSCKGGNVDINGGTVKPKYIMSEISKATNLIGTYKTEFSAGVTNRNTNITVAANKINDIVVMPGAVFSTNDAFGPSTLANGYVEAAGYSGGKVVPTIGGGMCQVSSTLYSALLYSELEIVERQNHSMPVSYVPGGMDATLVDYYIDLKFRNNTNYPVTIETFVTKTSVTVNIYGYETRASNRSLEFFSEHYETIKPGAESIIEDPSLPLGARVTETWAKDGGRYKLYKIVLIDGVETERILINKSSYKAINAEVRVGTKVEATEEPESTPETTPDTATTPTQEPIPISTPEPTQEPEQTPIPEPTQEPTLPPEQTEAPYVDESPETSVPPVDIPSDNDIDTDNDSNIDNYQDSEGGSASTNGEAVEQIFTEPIFE